MDLPQLNDYADLADYYDALDAWPCPHGSGLQGLEYSGPVKMSNGEIHEARYRCACGVAVGWRTKPRSSEQRKATRPRRGKHRLAAPLGTDKCFTCGMTREEARLLGQDLEEAHDDAYADLADAGLPDDPQHHKWLCPDHHREQELAHARMERIRMLLNRLRASA